MKTKFVQAVWISFLVLLALAPMLRSQKVAEPAQVAAAGWRIADPKPGHTG